MPHWWNNSEQDVLRGIYVKRGQIDYQLLIVVGILLAIGTIMVFSASAPTAYDKFNDAFYYLKKQLLMLAIGTAGMIAATFINYDFYKKFSWYIYAAGIGMLLLVFTPLGVDVNGARRWLDLGFTTVQPSEFMKFAMIILVARHLSLPGAKLDKLKNLLFYIILLIPVIAILQMQPHLSATVIIALTVVVLLLTAGMKLRYFTSVVIAGALGVATLIAMAPFRAKRFLAFLEPFNPENIRGDNWQIVNSLLAIGSGGWFGKGLGKSVQKFMYIPEPHNDFIFAIYIEEMGFIGALIVIILFAFLVYRGYSIAFHAPDKFSAFLATGITTIIAIQTIMNIMVVTSLMPVTGVSLPFFSYGGTSLIFLMFSMGILLNISKNSDKIA